MDELSSIMRNALSYINNAGGRPEISWFDDDHDRE
jgi:hypothetical protein